MNRRHAAVIAAFLALAVVLGVAAMARTARLGPAPGDSPRPAASQVSPVQHAGSGDREAQEHEHGDHDDEDDD